MSADLFKVIFEILSRWEGLFAFRQAEDGRFVLHNADGERLLVTSESGLKEMVTYLQDWDAILTREAAEPPSAAFNGGSTIKSGGRRGRPLDPLVAARRNRVIELAEQFQPATIRQIYYLAETRGLVPKDDNGYRRIQHDVLLLRQTGRIRYDWISDNTRWMRKSNSYRGIEHFLHLTIGTYRRDLWASAPAYVEAWCEKDAVAGVILEETDPYDVPLMVARGFSSETYLYEAAQAIAARQKPAYIYAFFDHDPAGQLASEHIERKLREFAPAAKFISS